MDRRCAICLNDENQCCGLKRLPTFKEVMDKILQERTRAMKRGLPATLTVRQYLEALEYFSDLTGSVSRWACAYCGNPSEKLSIDHWIAISSGGGTESTNCVPACPDCNMAKGPMTGDEFFTMLIERFKAKGSRRRYRRAKAYFAAVEKGKSLLNADITAEIQLTFQLGLLPSDQAP